MSKCVVVTGANGFLGRYVSKYYSDNGWFVSGLGHGEWPSDSWKEYGLVSWHSCNVTIEALKAHAEKPDLIVHCAGGSSVKLSIDNPIEDFNKTVLSAIQVLEFIRLHSPKTSIVYPSSVAVYGDVESCPINEKDNLNPVSPYGAHKKIVEELFKSYAYNYFIESFIIRLFSVYGNGLKKQLLWDACSKINIGNTSFDGTGDEIRDWIHARDVAALIYKVKSYASTDCPVINGACGHGVSNRELLNVLFKCAGRDDEPIFTGVPRQGDPSRYIANTTNAIALGWEPSVDLVTGMQEYVGWFNSNHMNSGGE